MSDRFLLTPSDALADRIGELIEATLRIRGIEDTPATRQQALHEILTRGAADLATELLALQAADKERRTNRAYRDGMAAVDEELKRQKTHSRWIADYLHTVEDEIDAQEAERKILE